MSYSDDRDELTELFGPEKKDKSGYSDELSLPKPGAKRPAEEAELPPRKEDPSKSPARSHEVEIPKKRKTSTTRNGESADKVSEFAHPSVPEPKEEILPDTPSPEAIPAAKKFKKVPAPQPESESPSHSDNPPKRVGKPKAAVSSTEEVSAPDRLNVEDPPLPDPETPSRPSSEKEFLLKTDGLVKIYDGRTVVNGVEINVWPGEIVGLLGPNGAGKTTSFYMIVGLVPPNGGSVTFDNQDVTELPMYQRARLGMGYLPQEESIFRKLTVEENIMAVMETLDISKKERKARTEELLERFSITQIRNNIALTCSGGEKRRLTIARSLATNPRLLMLDEPFSGVDPIAVNEIQSIVEDLRKSGLAILITDHNARQTLELVDRAYLIYEGKVLREGHRDFLINDPVSRELYLGDRFTM